MTTLVIVDVQNDYITGTMSFKGAKSILDPIKKYIKDHKNEICKILFTCDWHPYNHSSFKRYGGQYQYHCIQFTPGACIEPKLLKFVQSLSLNYEVCLRGQIEELEEPGAFSEIEYVSDQLGETYYFDSVATADATSNFVVCGILEGVKATIQNMIEGGITPKLFLSGITSPDGGKSISQFIKEFKLEKVN